MDWGYCRPCPAAEVTPKCAFATAEDGSQPTPRLDQWQNWSRMPSNAKTWPAFCSSVHPLGQCAPEQLIERRDFQHLYCLRAGVTALDRNAADQWGYCRDCPDWVLSQAVLAEVFASSPGVREYINPVQQGEGGECWGAQECTNGLQCIGRKCRVPPMSSWGIRKKMSSDTPYYARYDPYLAKMQEYHRQVVRNNKRLLFEYRRIADEEKWIQNRQRMMVGYTMGANQLQLYEDLHRGKMAEAGMDPNSPAYLAHQQAADALRADRLRLESRAQELKRQVDHSRRMVGIYKRVADNQAKQNSAKYRALMEKMYDDERSRWPETTPTTPEDQRRAARDDPNYPHRSHSPRTYSNPPSQSDIDRLQTDLDDMAKNDLQDRARNKKRGAVIGHTQEDTARWGELMTADGRGALSLEGSYQYQLGACEEGLCAEVGAAVTVAYEHQVYDQDGVSITVRTEAEVFVDAGASVGCSTQVQGCQITLSAAAGAKVGASSRVKQDLGNGVTADYTAAVEAGYIAKAEAEAGCTSKKGCKAKAKAFAGAYAKATSDAQVGTEDVSGKVGGSVMAGAGAGGGGSIGGVYGDGELKLSAEACGMLLVGVCANVELKVDLSGAEEAGQQMGQFFSDLAGEDGPVSSEMLSETSAGLEDLGHHLGNGGQALWDDMRQNFGFLQVQSSRNSTDALSFGRHSFFQKVGHQWGLGACIWRIT